MEEVTVTIEFETNTLKNISSSSYEPQQNEETFLKLKKILNNELPNVKVIQVAPISSNKKANESLQSPITNNPISDSFEIYLFNQLIFSKKRLGKLPSISTIVAVIKKMTQDKLDIAQTYQDIRSQISKLNSLTDSKGQKLPVLKNNVNHRIYSRNGRANLNKHNNANLTNPGEGFYEQKSISVSHVNKFTVINEINKTGMAEKSLSPLRKRSKVTANSNNKRATSQVADKNQTQENFRTKIVNIYTKSNGFSQIQKRHTKVESSPYINGAEMAGSKDKPNQRKGESLSNNRPKSVSKVFQKINLQLMKTKNGDSAEIEAKKTTKEERSRQKSLCLGQIPKQRRSLSQQVKIESFKDKIDESFSSYVMNNSLIKDNSLIQVGNILCEDGDSPNGSVSYMNSDEYQQERYMVKFTEGDGEINATDLVRTTADFGQKIEEFLSKSLPIPEFSHTESNKRIIGRYSDISIEVDDFNEKSKIEICESVLSFGGSNIVRNSEIIENLPHHSKCYFERKYKLPRENIATLTNAVHKDNENTPSDLDLSSVTLEKRYNNMINEAFEKLQKEENVPLRNTYNFQQDSAKNEVLELNSKCLDFYDSLKNCQGKRSTPHFAPAKRLCNMKKEEIFDK